MKPLFETMLDRMTLEIEKDYQQWHCVFFKWEIRSNNDKTEYRIDICVDYPLSNSTQDIYYIITPELLKLKHIKKDIINFLDTYIALYAEDWGYKRRS